MEVESQGFSVRVMAMEVESQGYVSKSNGHGSRE